MQMRTWVYLARAQRSVFGIVCNTRTRADHRHRAGLQPCTLSTCGLHTTTSSLPLRAVAAALRLIIGGGR